MNTFTNGHNKSLEWTATKPSLSIDFLDLTITIEENGNINTKTFQKSLNLYLYIPPNSAHPPGALKGLIYGNIQKFWNQNTNKEDFRNLTKKFYKHLCNRGHNATKIKSIFIDAANHLKNQLKITCKDEQKSQTNKIYLHVPYHPQQVNRQQLQEHFKSSCKDILNQSINNDDTTTSRTTHMNIAYSRPKNIRDLICRTKLSKNSQVQQIINEINEINITR